MMPDAGPDAAEIVLAGGPGEGGVEAEAGDREGQAEFGILLEEIGDLVAGEVGDDEVRLGRPDLQQQRREVGRVGRHQLVGGELATIGLHEALGDLAEIMAEGVVGGEREPLLALDQALRQQRAAGALHIHRVLVLDMEHVAVAALAAQRIGIAAGVEEQLLVARRDLRDRQAGGRRDLADDTGDLVALEHALGLGRGGLRVDRILLQQFELAAVDPAGGVDLLGGKIGGHDAIFAERAEEAGARRQVPEADRIRTLCEDDRRAGDEAHGHAAEPDERLTTREALDP